LAVSDLQLLNEKFTNMINGTVRLQMKKSSPLPAGFHLDRKLHTSFDTEIEFSKNDEELSVVQKILEDSCFLHLDAQNTPKSISITRDQNKIIRMPDCEMMIQHRQLFHHFLSQITQHPSAFVEMIHTRREEMTKNISHLHSPAALHRGQITDYQILGMIGKGRFACVYRCRDHENRQFAMKVLDVNKVMGKRRKYLANCEREIGLLKRLDHINVIKYFNSFFTLEKLCIILELGELGDLQQVIRECKTRHVFILEKTIWGYHHQLCCGLQHLHEHRILHRDLKPSNVFVTPSGCLKLGDLGLGRYLDWASVAAFSQVGTPLYMSPEVLNGDGYDFSSDIWSLGCILYEMSMLDSPFFEEGLAFDKILQKIVRGCYNPLKKGMYSSILKITIESMLQTVPSKRPQIELLTPAALFYHTQFNLLTSHLTSAAQSELSSPPTSLKQNPPSDVQIESKKTGFEDLDALQEVHCMHDMESHFHDDIVSDSNFEKKVLHVRVKEAEKCFPLKGQLPVGPEVRLAHKKTCAEPPTAYSLHSLLKAGTSNAFRPPIQQKISQPMPACDIMIVPENSPCLTYQQNRKKPKFMTKSFEVKAAGELL